MAIRDTTYYGWNKIYEMSGYTFNSFTIDNSGSMYLLGIADNTVPAVVLKSVAKNNYSQFALASTVYTPFILTNNDAYKIAHISGSLFLIGETTSTNWSSDGNVRWITARSNDEAKTWSVVDSVFSGGSYSRPSDIACDASRKRLRCRECPRFYF